MIKSVAIKRVITSMMLIHVSAWGMESDHNLNNLFLDQENLYPKPEKIESDHNLNNLLADQENLYPKLEEYENIGSKIETNFPTTNQPTNQEPTPTNSMNDNKPTNYPKSIQKNNQRQLDLQQTAQSQQQESEKNWLANFWDEIWNGKKSTLTTQLYFEVIVCNKSQEKKEHYYYKPEYYVTDNKILTCAIERERKNSFDSETKVLTVNFSYEEKNSFDSQTKLLNEIANLQLRKNKCITGSSSNGSLEYTLSHLKIDPLLSSSRDVKVRVEEENGITVTSEKETTTINPIIVETTSRDYTNRFIAIGLTALTITAAFLTSNLLAAKQTKKV